MKMYLPPPKVRSSRRVVLKRGLLGSFLLLLGGGGWLFSRRSAEGRNQPGLRVLTAQEHAVVLALVLRFIPRRQGFPRPEELDVAVGVDRILALADDTVRMEIRRLLLVFENALPNFLFGGRTKPFTQMSVEEQDRVLLEWRDSRVTLRRSGYLALRTLVNAAYYGNPAVWPALRYPGPPPGVYEPTAPVWRAPPVEETILEAPPVPDPDGGTP